MGLMWLQYVKTLLMENVKTVIIDIDAISSMNAIRSTTLINVDLFLSAACMPPAFRPKQELRKHMNSHNNEDTCISKDSTWKL